jgi:hypothetical protein
MSDIFVVANIYIELLILGSASIETPFALQTGLKLKRETSSTKTSELNFAESVISKGTDSVRQEADPERS